jgi:HD-GYP domain-containing protein (c-di-GMP phosphodiesterase class II)
MAGLVHDIGKISVPAEILSKPARLGPIEYALVKVHACHLSLYSDQSLSCSSDQFIII